MCAIVQSEHDKPLHALYDGGLLLCSTCFNRELEHRRGAKEILLNDDEQ